MKSNTVHSFGRGPLIVASVLLAAASLPVAAADFEQQVSADPHGMVEVTNVSGETEVTAWDRPEVRVEAKTGTGVERIDVQSQPGRTVVKVVLPGFSIFGGGFAKLNVKVPRGSRLEISSVSARVKVAGVEGAHSLHSVSGSIEGDAAGDSLDVKTVSGDVSLRGSGRPGKTRVSTVSGDVRLEHTAGEVEAGTVSGSLDLRVDPARSLRVRTTSGRVNVEGTLLPGASVDGETISGDLRVHAHASDGYHYEVSTFSGRIDDCFNVRPERTSQHGPGERLSGALGAGSGQVSLRSLSGAVELCDR
jgi:hypothetical protein